MWVLRCSEPCALTCSTHVPQHVIGVVQAGRDAVGVVGAVLHSALCAHLQLHIVRHMRGVVQEGRGEG